jgi:hypothetical protein
MSINSIGQWIEEVIMVGFILANLYYVIYFGCPVLVFIIFIQLLRIIFNDFKNSKIK